MFILCKLIALDFNDIFNLNLNLNPKSYFIYVEMKMIMSDTQNKKA